MTDFVDIFLLEAEDARTAIELLPQNFIRLAETVQLSGQLDILTLQAGCVLLQRFLLSQEVSVGIPVLLVAESLIFNVSPRLV